MKSLSKNAQIGEIENASRRIVSAFEQHPIDDAKLSELIITIGKQADLLTTAILRNKTASVLDELDTIRDAYWVDFVYVVQGYAHSILPELSKPANKLLPVTDRYGIEITRESYANQSALMNSVLEELSSDSMQVLLRELPGLPELLDAVKNAQTNFYKAQVEYDEARATDGLQISATEQKRELVLLLNSKLIVYLKAAMVFNNSEVANFANIVGEIVADVNSKVARRRK